MSTPLPSQRPLRATPPTFQVGLFIAISTLILFGVLFWLKGRDLQAGQTYDVRFNDVDGLKKGAAVQLMGIRIGFVEEVKPVFLSDENRYQVSVRFRITQQDVAIPKATQVSIEQSGLISEKLLELTPPERTQVVVSLPSTLAVDKPQLPVQLLTQVGWLNVGAVEQVEALAPLPQTAFVPKRHLHRYRLWFRFTKPGALLPEIPRYDWHNHALRISSADATWKPLLLHEETESPFTVLPPIRLKDFLEIQMASAESFKQSNDKLAALLDDETIQELQALLGNVNKLSNQVATLVATTNNLLKSVDSDLQSLVQNTSGLTQSLTALVEHTDGLLKDPVLQSDLKAAVHHLNESSQALTALLQDSEIKALISEARSTTGSLHTLSTLATTKLKNEQLTTKLDATLSEMNTAFERVNTVLGKVEASEQSGDSNVQALLKDTQTTVSNLKAFSERLKGRFVLLRLMF